MKITNCAECQKEINLEVDAQTWCDECKKDFCFSWNSTCFAEYHIKNNLIDRHRALSISNPSWKINLIKKQDKEISMSQVEPNPINEIFGSRSKTKYEPYTDEELDSDEFFWNQMEVIVRMKNMEYFYHFLQARSNYLDKMSGM